MTLMHVSLLGISRTIIRRQPSLASLPQGPAADRPAKGIEMCLQLVDDGLSKTPRSTLAWYEMLTVVTSLGGDDDAGRIACRAALVPASDAAC